MTLPALSQPKVQAFINPALSGANEWCACIDAANGIICSTGPADAQTYLTEYDFATGAVLNYGNIGSKGIFPPSQSAMTFDPAGNVWVYNNENAGTLPAPITQLVPSSNFLAGQSYPNNTYFLTLSFAWTTVGGNSYLFGGSFAQAGAYLYDVWALEIGGTGITPNGAYQNTGGTTTVVAGPPGTVYWTVQPFGIYGTAFALGASTVSGSGLSSSTIKSYLPTDFDTNWTGGGTASIQSFSGPAYDHTDGNVIIFVTGQGNGGANFASYVAKLSVIDGSVLWKVAVADDHGFNDEGITCSVIKYGFFLYFAATTQTLYVINTADGSSVTTTSTGGVTQLAVQSSNDLLGCIIGNAVWNSAGGAITLLNGSPDNTASLAAIYLTQAAAGGNGGWANNNYPALNRAWTYTMDGHTFYVLPLGPQGTWVYDSSTNEWAKWDTQTYGTFWNMIYGCMWGYRVVAGSMASTDVWELAPSLLVDEGIWDINHAVTGIIDVRSRRYYAVESVYITASAGLLDETDGATITLSFSDDQGMTWSQGFSQTLVEGNTTQEIAWRSLGSFGRPGRVFQIQDVGGMIRIDGADVFLDNFDEQEMQQQGDQQ